MTFQWLLEKMNILDRTMPDWAGDYSPEFVEAVSKTLHHEGFFSDDEDDPGGPTKYGVSLRWLRTKGKWGDFDGDGDVDRDDIWAMEEADAVRLYHEFWWVETKYDKLHKKLGPKVFDIAINMGVKSANKCLQRAVRSAEGSKLIDDGILGRRSIAAIKRAKPDLLLIAFKSETAGHYRMLTELNKVFKKYINGWLNRAYS
jgi:lysozyme family protein